MARPDSHRITQERAKALRHALTYSEARLWGAIKSQKAGARFRRQVPIGHWIVNFASLDPALVVEVDDPSHDHRDETSRTAYLESQGFAILRFTNKEIAQGFPEVLGTIEFWIATLKATGRPPE